MQDNLNDKEIKAINVLTGLVTFINNKIQEDYVIIDDVKKRWGQKLAILLITAQGWSMKVTPKKSVLEGEDVDRQNGALSLWIAATPQHIRGRKGMERKRQSGRGRRSPKDIKQKSSRTRSMDTSLAYLVDELAYFKLKAIRRDKKSLAIGVAWTKENKRLF